MHSDKGQVMIHEKMVGSRATERGFSPSLSSEVGKGGQRLSGVTKEGSQQDLIHQLTGVSNLLASLGHAGKRVILGHTLNIQTLTKTDEQIKDFK